MKDAYYFSHDTNARNDPKIAAMRQSYGVEGYGLYWIVVEMLAERNAPGEIRRGRVVNEVFDFCRKYGADEIHVTRSPAPAYLHAVEQLRSNFVVVEYAPDDLLPWQGRPPRRFMDLWKDALPRVLPETWEP
jgi:hypothetical protein